ncbi:multidrug efflux SMR transporter [Mammaliicoccus sciuri]|uniref:Paired small multidrug resistance pump n=2 Tax=Sporosarcina newyorkensis TaxID=759851 RepID=A0A1T4Y1W5_9BACL|nr:MULTISPECIES: multidrug efflux SMR transporter [Sporosarcina]EGQ27024.1 DMT superfamily drug/metabolite transporter SugE [Sporosarcina newyorkensis 2681]MBY0221472.1 multidrug efflux SMR transporter [Sporosarcina aquimarina]SKA95321.1 paired small multidrug resistance pump [Sporosarcina newyorkensis]
MSKAWMYVALTSFFELVWIFGFNTASQWWHWIFIVGFIFIDFHFLTKACEGLPTGTVYAVFAGIGTVGTSLMDVLFFGEHISLGKIFFIFILVLGVAGLKIADGIDEKKALKEVEKHGMDAGVLGRSE